MFCSNCGNEVGSEDGYCLNCGKKLNDSQNSAIRYTPTPKKEKEGKRRLLLAAFVCAVAFVLTNAVLALIAGEMSKGSLEGHTSASVTYVDWTTPSNGVDLGFDLNAANGIALQALQPTTQGQVECGAVKIVSRWQHEEL